MSAAGGFLTPGTPHAELERRYRRLLAFLYSTPAYGKTLELYGIPELGEQLRSLIREARWDDLPSVLPDELLDTLLVVGHYDELGPRLAERFSLVVPDLRGYGWSSAPRSDEGHRSYSKRAMGRDIVAVMEALLAPFRGSGQLTVLLEHVPESATTRGDRARGKWRNRASPCRPSRSGHRHTLSS